jgi:hypothetical protein
MDWGYDTASHWARPRKRDSVDAEEWVCPEGTDDQPLQAWLKKLGETVEYHGAAAWICG